MNLADKLKELRLSKHLTQQDLADMLFISRSLYAKYENNISTPSDDFLAKLANIYDMPINDLIAYKTSSFDKIFKFNRIVTLILLLVSIAFVLFYFVPIFPVFKYVYPAPIGEQPERVKTFMSSFSLLCENDVWLGNLALSICIVGIIYSIVNIFFLKIAKKYLIVISFSILSIFIVLFFLTITFSCGYTF